ncbi:flagellin N-terminal helical domain-containing protein [Clostridium botulinum]|uniref:Flagellin n=2 Tax=Clostridium botulinum TaxID=1491 RepID=A5HYD5_CLOBH|nr:flagellin [Clostridium botulinum]EPS46262.1 flagellin protein [Clostridium botulinum CFSAN002369]EPS46369.1 flagellin protein [Clostridium botulinum CFSAN002367]ABS35615.1 flagellin protein [Clostridium botulinum A str. ATCC 19397]ABS39096.1 flagellin protein [Clostridium botulinum A str. Hall]AWB16158.1 flagellin [Clostridium botulinum]
MIINHNVNAMIAYRNIMINGALAGKAMERLASGMRINRASDDPAGLAISEKMRAQIRGLEMASRNVQDGISMIQVAEGGVKEIQSMLQRMRELAVQAANGTNSPEDRKNIQDEINQLTRGIDDIANGTEFNTIKILNANAADAGEVKLQIGANEGQFFGIKLQNMNSAALGINGNTDKDGVDVSTSEKASAAIKVFDDAINKTSSFMSSLGASSNMLEHRINYLENTIGNLTEAESRIRDADMAKEMMNYTKYSVLQQVAQAIFSQVLKQQESTIQLLKSLNN